MSQTARKGNLKGKPHIRKAEEEKKEWISHNKRRKERSVWYTVEGKETRRENGRSPVRGQQEDRGLVWRGTFVFWNPSSSPAFPLRHPSPSLYFLWTPAE